MSGPKTQNQSDSLFNNLPRDDMQPASHQESSFEFLDRIGGCYWDRVRALIDQWYQCIPSEHQPALRARFQKRNSVSTYAAFWEIYLHEVLLRHGYEVIIHPKIPNSTKAPDFLAQSEEDSFYLEATSYFDRQTISADERQRAALYDAINQLWDPNFHLWLDIEQSGANLPPGAPLRHALAEWLGGLDPDAVAASEERGDMFDLPSFTWERGGWTISFWAIPIKPSARGKRDSRLIGVYGRGRAQMIDDKAPIRSRLATKARKYGQLDRPLVIALCCHTMFVDETSVIDALFGDDVVRITRDAEGEIVPVPARRPNGFWRRHNGRATNASLES